jgi:rhomboid family protein
VRNLNRNDGGGYDDSGYGQQQMQMSMPSLTPVTKRLLIINVAVFLATFIIGVAPGGALDVIFNFFGLTPKIWSGWAPFEPIWQLVTYSFLHSTQAFSHILWNMVQLYFFGTMLEGIIGARRFLVFYLAAAVLGGALHLIVEFATGSMMPAIGASGAVLGVVVAAATLRPHAKVFVFFIPVSMMVLAGVIVAIDVLSAVNNLSHQTSDGVAHWVHLGGALCGFAMVRTGWIYNDWVERFRAKRAIATEEKRVKDDYDMDQLLEKIHSEGMNSLTKREKDFLKRVSNRK